MEPAASGRDGRNEAAVTAATRLRLCGVSGGGESGKLGDRRPHAIAVIVGLLGQMVAPVAFYTCAFLLAPADAELDFLLYGV